MARKEVHPDFIEYTHSIAKHKAYEGMPDLLKDDGEIQWEAPSNRRAGKFKDTHHKRREWWRRKAFAIGIDPQSANWISRTAKAIHPFGAKPCGVCGKVMELRYAYPSTTLLNRLRKLPYFTEDFPLDDLEHIGDLISRMIKRFGNQAYDDLPDLLRVKGIDPPCFGRSISEWIEWIDSEYIPQEPSTLSPGAMANPPDRLDGFHTYNKCCRHKADKGRHLDNLRSYTTDRRVFEFWNNGDWIAADRLMGLVRSRFREVPCINGHPGPCSADHIGPLSLGFTHRPEFQLLCAACNSAKNNRMTLSDVQCLRTTENKGEVASWYAKNLWDLLKNSVTDNETALRLSKMLRDNRHTIFRILYCFAQRNKFVFLISFLELGWADYDIEFEGLTVINNITHFNAMRRTSRTTRYTIEQKTRHVRIALESLLEYFGKENRNEFVVMPKNAVKKVALALRSLSGAERSIGELDARIKTILAAGRGEAYEPAFRQLLTKLPTEYPPEFSQAKLFLHQAIYIIAQAFADMWTDTRYLRAGFDF